MKQTARTQRSGLKLGVIGVGTRWEQAFFPALNRLRQRTQIIAVYNPAANLSQQVADSCRAKSVHGIKSLLQEQEVEAVLLLDGDWLNQFVLHQLCQLRVPAVVSLCALAKLQNLKNFHELAVANGLTLMPELNLRHMPATIRLQELMATRFGAAEQIVVQAPQNENMLITILDWCLHIFGQKATSLHCKQHPAITQMGSEVLKQSAREIEIHFSGHERSDVDRTARIIITEVQDREQNRDCTGIPATEFHCNITFATGMATINGPAQISWQQNNLSNDESLESERSDVEVILDHFCRRVVGGLIPVPDLSDLMNCQHLIAASEESLKSGETISLD